MDRRDEDAEQGSLVLHPHDKQWGVGVGVGGVRGESFGHNLASGQ